MKNIKKAIITFTTAALTAISLCTGFAAPEVSDRVEQEVLTLEETANIIIYAVIDDFNVDDNLYVNIKRPSGSLITNWNDPYEKETSEGVISFSIPLAEKGTWSVVYDRSLEGHIKFQYGAYGRDPEIKEFNMDIVNDSTVKTIFNVVIPEKDYLHYTLRLLRKDDAGNTVWYDDLKTDSVYGDLDQTFEFELNGIPSSELYFLELNVEWEDHGVTASAYEEIGPFKFVNKNMPKAFPDCDITVDVDMQQILIDWTDYVSSYSQGGYIESYNVDVFKKGETVPFYSEKTDGDVTSVSCLFDTDYAEFDVKLTYVSSSFGISEPLIKHIDINALKVTAPQSIAENASSYELKYDLSVPSAVLDIFVNNEDTESMTVTKSGKVAVSLENGQNIIQVIAKISDSFSIIYTFRPGVDKIPPILVLPEVNDTIRVESNLFKLVGYTEEGATFLVNGEAVPLDGNGIFSHDLKIEIGSNIFMAEAIDAAGNKTSKTFEIIGLDKEKGASNKNRIAIEKVLPWLIFGGAILIFAGALALIIAFAKTGKLKKIGILCLCASGCGFVVAICLFIQKIILSLKLNGIDFIEAVQESISKAYEMITRSSSITLWMFVGLIIFAVFGVAGTILLIIDKKQKATKTNEH